MKYRRILLLSVWTWAQCFLSVAGFAAPAQTPALTDNCAPKLAKQTIRPADAGYQITSVHWDPVLKQQWTVVKPCGKPEAPAMLVPLREDALPAISITPLTVIHAGDVVHIRQEDAVVRMEFTGVAEESGIVGGRVRIHMLPATKSTPEYRSTWNDRPKAIRAIVRGPHEVEIE